MSANRFNAGSRLGVGVGLRATHTGRVLSGPLPVEWFEIISENYLLDGGRPLAVIDALAPRVPLVQHGVGLNVGSAQGVSRDHLKRLAQLARRTRTPWLSDHLAWSAVDGAFTHDLLPLPYTRAIARRVAENIRVIQGELGLPFALENVSSYTEYTESTMTEWQFLSEIVEAADCGILLDVNNIYVSSVNHGFDPVEYVKHVPHERVAQIHLAGHARHEHFIIDTHDAPVVDDVWSLYELALSRCGPTPTLIEWDGRIPSFEVLCAEADKARPYLAAARGEVARAG